jgi:uncharacterized protein (DUF58 family)
MLTATGKGLLAVAAVLYLAAWGFGTLAMFPVAIGLAIAPLIALVWVRTLTRPMQLRRRPEQHDLVEGSTFAVQLVAWPEGGPLPARATLDDGLGDTARITTELVRRHRALRGRHVIERAPRGRYVLHRAQLEISDPFGLARSITHVGRADTILVYPKVYELDGLFTDSGAPGGDRGRMLLHRTSGYDLHSIREFQHGESLRRVHWRSTAKRGRLMVKEMEDTPRDEAAVVLDCDAQAVAGSPPDSSFDVQVRAAASLLHRLVESGQRSSLIIHGRLRRRIRIGGGGATWPAVLAELATVDADAPRPLATLLAQPGGGGVDAVSVFVVTAAMTAALADRLLAIHGAQRRVAVVWVDAPSFAGAGGRPGIADGAALRLARSGIAVARIRQGDSIPERLSSSARLAAHA